MTQVISVITKEYVLLASDRRLTVASGKEAGNLIDDDTCKLVNLCNVCGIGYTGLAKVRAVDTYEWIARTLAAENCRGAASASSILTSKATEAFTKYPQKGWRQLFVMAGWAHFKGMEGLRSHYCIISNMLDAKGQWLQLPRDEFGRRIIVLQDNEKHSFYSTHSLISEERAKTLRRNISRLLSRGIGPKEILRLLVDEIVFTSYKDKSVGNKILCLCIPKLSTEFTITTGRSFLIAKEQSYDYATFAYFDPSYSSLQQYGPAFVCGRQALKDLKVENDPENNYQSVEIKMIGDS